MMKKCCVITQSLKKLKKEDIYVPLNLKQYQKVESDKKNQSNGYFISIFGFRTDTQVIKKAKMRLYYHFPKKKPTHFSIRLH